MLAVELEWSSWKANGLNIILSFYILSEILELNFLNSGDVFS
jgi:hypothetical protein